MSKSFPTEKKTPKTCAQFAVSLIDHHQKKKALCISRFSAQFIEIAHTDEGPFNCSSFLACLNVFHLPWNTEEGKEEQQGGIAISSSFLLILLIKKFLLQ